MALLPAFLLAGCATPAVHAGAADPPRLVARTVQLTRGPSRPLPVVLWYRSPPAGRHPIVLFSHGLGGLPRQFAPLATTWVNAGYVVAAPTYPRTNARVRVEPADVRNQPADAAYVLARVRALDRTAGDPLAGHLATDRVAAIGFSAGGTTTLGLLTAGHDRSLRAAVSIAGRRPATAFAGPPVPVLLVHGDRDRTVAIAAGRAAYAAVPWPKRFLTVTGEGHGQYLTPGDPGYPRVSASILEFLRANLG